MSKVGKSYKKTVELRAGTADETTPDTLITVTDPDSTEDFTLDKTEFGAAYTTPHVNVENPLDVVYVSGDETTNGSVRIVIDALNDIATIEERTDGVWNIGELQLSQGSLLLGRDLRISAGGHHIIVTTQDIPNQSLLLAVPFDDTGTFNPENTILGPRFVRRVQQPDDSGSVTTDDHTTAIVALNLTLSTEFYIKVGETGASEDVSIVLSEGVPPNDIVFFQKNFPASAFPANTEISFSLEPGVQFDADIQINSIITSAAAFTLLYESTLTVPWFALDFQLQEHEDLLTETLVLGNDLSLTFSNQLELARPNKDLPVLT